MKSGRYLSAMIGALIVIAIAAATFIYSLVKAEPEDLESVLIEITDDGTALVNPGGGLPFPQSAPSIAPPTSPPPNQ